MRLPRFTTRRCLFAVLVAAVIAAGVEWTLIGASLWLLDRAARRPHPVRPITALLLTLLTGAWLWANLRDPGWQADWNVDAPEGLDPIAKAMFYRGWPLAPFMVCPTRGMTFHPSGFEGMALILDGAGLIVALYATRAACERLPR